MLKLNPIFADEMILQANKPVIICGEGDGNVTVTIGTDSATVSTKDGKWLVELPSHGYGEIFDIKVTCGDANITLENATFGDVYLLGGQSNIEFKLKEGVIDGEIFECADVRFFSTQNVLDDDFYKPHDGWVKCDKTSAPELSSIGYYFAREEYKKNPRPIGFVAACQGASVIQTWLSKKAIEELYAELPESDIPWDKRALGAYEWNANTYLHDFVFSQVAPFRFAAVVWYQGESNAKPHECQIYDVLLLKLIESWREELMDSSLRFVIIQIADNDERAGEPWTRVQQMQELVASKCPNTVLVKSADICETDNIHPPTKHILAKRISDSI